MQMSQTRILIAMKQQTWDKLHDDEAELLLLRVYLNVLVQIVGMLFFKQCGKLMQTWDGHFKQAKLPKGVLVNLIKFDHFEQEISAVDAPLSTPFLNKSKLNLFNYQKYYFKVYV